MDDNVLDTLGLELVNYFINYEDYRPFNVPKNLKNNIKGEVYLTNKDSHSYHIIKIIKENNFSGYHLKNKDEIYDELRLQLAKDGVKEIRFLVVILNDNNENEISMSPTVDVIITTRDKVISDLVKFYPNISKLISVDISQIQAIEDNNIDDDNSSDKSGVSVLSANWKKVNFQNRHYLSDTLKKCSNANLAVTWFLFIIPIITFTIFFMVINFSDDGWLSLNYNLRQLLFGGNYYNLIFGAHQYWRWLVYPFVSNDSDSMVPINLLFSLWMFYRVGRFIEGFYGWWKAIIIWFAAMVLTGILQSVIDNIHIMSGFWVFPLISLGAMLPFIWNYKLFKTPIMVRFGSTIGYMIVFWYFTDSQIVTLLYWMIAFASGWLFASLVGYHNRKVTLFYAFSPVILGALVLFAGLLVLLNNNYPVDNNNWTAEVLKYYRFIGLISQNTIDSIMHNFFNN